jgi:hypothetical protein
MPSRSGSAYGSGRNSTAFTTLKIAAVAPRPMASVSTVMIVSPGVRLKPRSAYRVSAAISAWIM